MNAKVITVVLATFVMLFAGVAVADTVDAEASSVQFDVDGTIYTKEVSAFPSLADLKATLDEGTEFKGWEDLRETTEERVAGLYAPGSSIPAESEGAKWTAKIVDIEYTVSFVDKDGEAIGEASEGVLFGADVEVPVEGTDFDAIAGLLFVGWADADGNLVKVTDGNVKVKGDAVLKATYKADPVVTFVVDGITTYVHYTTGITYPTDPVKENFTFLGWAVDGEIALVAGADPSALTALALDKNTTFTAVFEPVLHTVTFVADGVTVLTQTVKHGELAVEPVLVPVKEGFEFKGWDYDFATPVVADVSIVAVFAEPVAPAPVMHTVSYVIGEEVVYTVEVEDGKLVSAPDFIPSVEGKVFVEWKFDFRVPVTADLSIEAVFEDVVPPEPTGMDDPVVKTVAILAGIVVLILLAVLVSKIKKGEPVLGIKLEKAKKDKKEGEE